MHALAVTVLIAAGLALASGLYERRIPAAQLASLKRENAALEADLARCRTELEMERSTRIALPARWPS